MRAFLDTKTWLWKWGRNGKPKYTTKEQAEREGDKMLSAALIRIKERIGKG